MAQEFEQVDQTELPYSLEAEQTILGSIFVDASVLSVVLERIKPDSFFNEQHKALFQIIMQMFTSGEKILHPQSGICCPFHLTGHPNRGTKCTNAVGCSGATYF